MGLAALVASLGTAALAAPTAWADQSVVLVNRGADGRDGESAFFWTDATAGQNAPASVWTQSAPISGVTGPALEIGSVGGAGGSVYSKGVFHNLPGKPGGNANFVSLEILKGADISGTLGTSTQAKPLINVYSIGGTGGLGYTSWTESEGGIARGGDGWQVYLKVGSRISAVSDAGTRTRALPAIRALSQGGAAGIGKVDGRQSQDGTYESRTDTDRGGAGGVVTVILDQSASVNVSGSLAPAVSASSLGGNGGSASNSGGYPSNGGAGGGVNFSNLGTVTTNGNNSAAVILQSAGGAGGSGANGAFTSGTPGGKGGAGGVVTATNQGTIATQGEYSFGIMAQSVGGVGGNGGGAAFTSGGDGGGAALGRLVSVTNYGTVVTTGKGSTAIMAQSIGGGSALDAFHASTPVISKGGGAGGNSGILPFASGGTGGLGGVGGDVAIEHRGNISTTGDEAYGVLAQSIGGGGGTGGAASSSSAFLAVALGGAGGGGGNGGQVTFNSVQGSIQTAGERGTAVLAQSIGGGGGAGGFATSKSVSPGLSASSATGGSGGKGGTGGLAKITNNSAIQTSGESALGLQASSIGGGGGTGGGADAFAVALPLITPSGETLPSIAITNAIGGSGGDGGWGKMAVVENNNAGIETFGVGATGILAQSIGGGGGNAGNAYAYGLAIAAPGASAFNVTNTIGGSGGGGGSSEGANVYNDGSVRTNGDGAFGIQVQSIGGGGGNAGSASASADALSMYRTITFGQSIGGTNSKGGGAGGTAKVENRGVVETRGTGATGILLQSIGGGGGNGGAVNASASSGLSFDKTLDTLVKKLPLADSISIVDAIGGNGGNGGNGSFVDAILTSTSVIRTRGAQSDGVLAQSIGGGGGTGGGGSAAASGKLSISLSFGGRGGAGGSGGAIMVNNAGLIETYGNASHGIFAQSIGGGGGDGGNLAAADAAPDTVGELFSALKKAVGVQAYQKWAADKGNKETKEELDALIKDVQNSQAYKELSDAFKSSDLYKEMQASGKSVTDYLDAQAKGSVKRPDLSLTLSMGGDGGTGNVGSLVDLTNSGRILTTGDVSYGMLGQSIGGGGGQGGVAYASGTNKTNLSGTLGGKGGSGNLGGEVKINNQGAIQTWGEASYGLYAQSVGGGGGIGVGALSSGNKNLVVNFTMGGNGGTGANGGTVSVTNAGAINTRGEEAHGIVAQSVGGGGGAFMMSTVGKESAAPAAADEKAASAGSIKELLKAVGIDKVAAASTDADGKKPSSKSGSFTLGGAGGGSGAGGTVNITNSGSVTTSGEAAFGIFAQSIGGGGGVSNAAGSPGGVKYAVSYGGKGGSSGNGGTINLRFTDNASIRTTGDYSTAVYAQSIGGGGGYGGASVLKGYTVPVLGGKGGTSGDGGYIEVRTSVGTTTIQTDGAKANGVFAQSLGGGGGTISEALKTDETARAALEKSATALAGIIGKVGGSGTVLDNIDKVPEDLQGIVRLFGNDKDTVDNVLTALRASLDQRSASKGTGGTIWIDLKGDIKTNGADSYGLFAQSGFQQSNGALDPNRAGGKVTVEYSGVLQGGSGKGAAIAVDGGNDKNAIIINSDAYVSALSGHAVVSTFGQESLRNFGTLVGDIDLASGGTKEWNEFRNEVGGTYVSGGSGMVNVSNGAGWFYNAGNFDVGGVGTIATSTIKGVDTHLGGALLVDVTSVAPAGAPRADLFKGSTILVDGVAVKPHAVDGLLPGSFTVLSADKLDVKRQAVSGASPASPIAWSVAQNGNNLAIAPSADFAGKAQGNITDTQRSLLNSLQRAWDASRPGMAGVFADMANIDSAEKYENAINSLAATEDLGQMASRQTLAGRKSLNAALSCPVFDGNTTKLRETQCTWARITGSRITQGDSSMADGSTQEGLSYRLGGQWEISPNWFFGVTGAYNTSSMHTDDRLTSVRGQGGDMSFSLKHQSGPWLLAGAVHGGYGSYDSSTLFMVGDDWWRAKNRNDVWTGGLRLRAAYEVTGDDWYVRPYADLDVLHTYMPGYTLRGDGATLKSGSMKQWAVAITPTVEAGTRIDAGRYGWLRPYASVGATFLNTGGSSSKVSFSENGADGITFTSKSALPDSLFNLGAGLQLYSKNKYEVRAEYLAQMGKHFTNQELSLRMAYSF